GLGCVADRSKGERAPEPPGLVGEPPTERPRLVLRVITVEAIEVERAQMKPDRRIAEEWRELLHALGEIGNDASEQRGCNLAWRLRGGDTPGRRLLSGPGP